MKMHGQERPRRMALLKCPWCKNEFRKQYNQTFKQKGNMFTCCSLPCRGKFSRFIQLNGKTINVEMAISENLVREYYSHENSEQTH